MATNEARKSIREMLAVITLMTLDLPITIDFQRRMDGQQELWLIFDRIGHAAAWAGAIGFSMDMVRGDQPRATLQRMWSTGDWHGWPVTLWAEERIGGTVAGLDAATVTALKNVQDQA